MSVHDGRRSMVEVSRADLVRSSSGEPVPVRVVENVLCSDPNGTIIDIEQIHLKSLDQPGCIKYIERHLARWPKNCTVIVNNFECEYSEPPIQEQRRFKPSGAIRHVLGDIELVIKVSKVPVDEELREYQSSPMESGTKRRSAAQRARRCLHTSLETLKYRNLTLTHHRFHLLT